MNIKKHIPNAITCLSMASGCVAIVMALQGKFLWTAIWVIIAAVFDFMDGFAARMLKAYSPMGKELDSLSDMVSFGVAPGMALFALYQQGVATLPFETLHPYIPYLAFVIPAFSGLRLAKFNIDERQTTSFIGLPTPAHALFWVSLCYSLQPAISIHSILLIPLLIIVSIGSSLLMTSEIPMFSLKIKSLAWKGNEFRYLLVFAAIVFTVLWGFLGIAGTILLYILLSVIKKS